MDKFIRISEFAKQLFAEEKGAQQANEIMEGILRAESPRLSDIAAKMPGNERCLLQTCATISSE